MGHEAALAIGNHMMVREDHTLVAAVGALPVIQDGDAPEREAVGSEASAVLAGQKILDPFGAVLVFRNTFQLDALANVDLTKSREVWRLVQAPRKVTVRAGWRSTTLCSTA